MSNKKEILNELNQYLILKYDELKNNLEELMYIKNLMSIYLNDADNYLDSLNEFKINLSNEINNKQYKEDDLSLYDDKLKIQLVTDRIAGVILSIKTMIYQYKKVVLQMSTNATLLNQIQIAKTTTIQNLYVELSINDGINNQKEAIEYLNNLKLLFKNLSEENSSNVLNVIKQTDELSKENYKNVLDDNDLMILEKIKNR